MQCPAEDDEGTRCTNTLSDEEKEQDGMCSRCADLIWRWYRNEIPEILYEARS